MRVPEPRRTLPRLAASLLVSAAVAVISVPAAQSASPSRPVARTAPSDLYRSQQWTLGALHVERSWKYSRGNGVTVAVLDTGVDGHQPDLAGRVIDGPDFTGHLRKPGGRYWGRHGTSMASIIAGHGHGAGGAAGVMGVAPDAKILSIRVTWELTDPARADHTQTDTSRDAIAQGIRYATDHGAQVISMSLGGGKLFYDGNPLEEAAIKYAQSKGVVLVASAGNDGNAANRRNYPAAYPGVIAVGAVDRADHPAKFTNRHTYVSVAAPGVEIVSADVAGHGYILGTGTSSSAAFVAGMSALVKARYPALTPPEVKQALEEGATHRPPDGRSTSIGTGVADALGTLVMAAKINKAEHAGAGVQQPATPPSGSPPAESNGPDLMLIAVLTGGGTLLILSLILGWRQRRRRTASEDEEVPADVPEPRRTRARATATSRSVSSGATTSRPGSPGERPSASPEKLSPWEPRDPTSSDFSPWERHSQEPPPADLSSWESPSEGREPSLEMTPWGDPFAEARPSDRDSHPAPRREESFDSWDSHGKDSASSSRNSHDTDSSAGSWDSHAEPSSSSWDTRTEEPLSSWDSHAEDPLGSGHSRTEASSGAWDSHAEPSSGAWDSRTEAHPARGTPPRRHHPARGTHARRSHSDRGIHELRRRRLLTPGKPPPIRGTSTARSLRPGPGTPAPRRHCPARGTPVPKKHPPNQRTSDPRRRHRARGVPTPQTPSPRRATPVAGKPHLDRGSPVRPRRPGMPARRHRPDHGTPPPRKPPTSRGTPGPQGRRPRHRGTREPPSRCQVHENRSHRRGARTPPRPARTPASPEPATAARLKSRTRTSPRTVRPATTTQRTTHRRPPRTCA